MWELAQDGKNIHRALLKASSTRDKEGGVGQQAKGGSENHSHP